MSDASVVRAQVHPVALEEPRLAPPSVALLAASLEILGGQGVEAALLLDAFRADGRAVTFIPINPRFPTGLRWVRRIPWLRTLLNQALYLPSLARVRHVDVVHVFSASYWSFLLGPVPAILAGHALGKRVVLHYHSGEADDHLARWGRRVHPWLRLVDAIVVPSEYLRAVFARHNYVCHVIRNVVDLGHFQYRERRPLRPRLLSTRNLEAHYRVDTVIEAFALVRARHPDATLTVAGYGSQGPFLRRLARSLCRGAVEFVGRVAPEDMPRLYDSGDILLNASVIDNQPVSILEAFAAGLPVVSTPTGGIAEMVRDGETGLVVPPDEPAALARGVDALLEEPQRAVRLARRARQEVAHYTWPSVREMWGAVYAGEQP